MRHFFSFFTFYIGLIAFSFFSCCGHNCNQSEKNDTPTAAMMVGADKDGHGCNASAGYQWSELKKDCVRPFELPLRILNPDKTSQTCVLFSADSIKAEVYALDGHFILERSAFGHYENRNSKQSAHLDRDEKGNWNWIFEY